MAEVEGYLESLRKLLRSIPDESDSFGEMKKYPYFYSFVKAQWEPGSTLDFG